MGAHAADDGLVSKQGRRMLGVSGHEDLYVQVPGRRQVDTERFATCFCWTMTTSPSYPDVSLERRRVNAGRGSPHTAWGTVTQATMNQFNVLTPQNTLLDFVGDQWLLNCRRGGGRLQGGGYYEGRWCG